MRPLGRYLKASASPLLSSSHILSHFSPQLFWELYNKKSKKAGFESLSFALSFDCDTLEDAKTVLKVDEELRGMGIVAAYAVPGEILEANWKSYETLAARGSHFLNHGYKTHTVWNESLTEYQSIFFYDQEKQDTVRKDIELGHACLTKFLGKSPIGFRAPHFGTFQTKWNLDFLHKILSSMGYVYSSSTLPGHTLYKGPYFYSNKLVEIPVSGIADFPSKPFDSWSFFSAPHRKWKQTDYLKQLSKMKQLSQELNLVGFLNYYADPSQIHDQKAFFDGIETLRSFANPIQFSEDGLKTIWSISTKS